MRRTILVLIVICLGSAVIAQQALKTSALQLQINSKSEITQLIDLKNNRDYVPEGKPGYLVRVKRAGKELVAEKMKVIKNMFTSPSKAASSSRSRPGRIRNTCVLN